MTPKQSIRAKCKECIYDSTDKGTWRQQVAACTSVTCALFEHRPLPIGASAQDLVKSVKNTTELDVLALA